MVDPAGDEIPEAAILALDAVDPSTEWKTVPISGSGPAGGVVRYTASLGGGGREEIEASGRFCIDVRLVPGSVNTMVFEAMSAEGALSEPITVEITQLGDRADVVIDDDDLVNVAEGATEFEIHASFEEGEFGDLVDGNKFNYTTIKNNGHLLDTKDWLAFRLPERSRIEKVVMHSKNDCRLDKYNLYVSDAEEPDRLFGHYRLTLGDNEPLGEDWVRVGEVEGGKPRQDVPLTLTGEARWLGIRFRSHDCGDFLGLGRHKISEIEVLSADAPDDELEDDGGPRCPAAADVE